MPLENWVRKEAPLLAKQVIGDMAAIQVLATEVEALLPEGMTVTVGQMFGRELMVANASGEYVLMVNYRNYVVIDQNGDVHQAQQDVFELLFEPETS